MSRCSLGAANTSIIVEWNARLWARKFNAIWAGSVLRNTCNKRVCLASLCIKELRLVLGRQFTSVGTGLEYTVQALSLALVVRFDRMNAHQNGFILIKIANSKKKIAHSRK